MARGKAGESARDRVLNAAYDLFRRHGTRAVGVDAIVARSGVSKMTLYRYFKSKDDLIMAFMDHREEVWRRQLADADAGAETPVERLLAVFDALDGWFRSDDFDGPSFVGVLLEHPHDHASHEAAISHIAKIRAHIAKDAAEAGLDDPQDFAETWQIMMLGAIIARCRGGLEAARQAKKAARLFLDARLPGAGAPKH